MTTLKLRYNHTDPDMPRYELQGITEHRIESATTWAFHARRVAGAYLGEVLDRAEPMFNGYYTDGDSFLAWGEPPAGDEAYSIFTERYTGDGRPVLDAADDVHLVLYFDAVDMFTARRNGYRLARALRGLIDPTAWDVSTAADYSAIVPR